MSSPADVVAELFELAEAPELSPRYNIAPTQKIAAVRVTFDNPDRALGMLQWGLIPAWAKKPSIGSRMINARAETIAQRPSFRSAFKRRRCLIVADGFYEWKKLNSGKQPYHIRMRDGQPFALAGLWERWRPPGREAIESCAIITTTANTLIAPLHNRMPVILPRDRYEEWLDPDRQDNEALNTMLASHSGNEWEAYPVSRIVNSPSNDTPECVKPAPLADRSR